MADVPFINFAFPASGPGVTTNRTMPERLADVVNVRDFGAVGDSNITNIDYHTQIQAAFNAAFKTSGADNGLTNSHRNRAVYIPGGIYYIGAPLTLNNIYGGKIYGAGAECTRLVYHGGASPILSINGFVGSTIEDMTFTGNSTRRTDNINCIELDGPADGLNSSMLINVGIQSADIGIRIGNSGQDGRGISLVHCNIHGNNYGVVVKGSSATTNVSQIGTSASECNFATWVQAGHCVMMGWSNAGKAVGSYVGQTDLLHDSDGTSTVTGGRSESSYCIVANHGKVNATGVLHASEIPLFTVSGSNGAEVSLTSSFINAPLTSNPGGEITGNVNIALRNVGFNREGSGDPIFAPGFTGKVIEYTQANAFTMATLPPRPVEGLLLSVSDADLTGKSWGDSITGTGSSHALLRNNSTTSTANWTLVGK